MKSWLTRSILVLSLVSLLNDAASELLYPVLPIYLAGIGFGAVWIGVLEGIAEAVAGLSKGWFGKWSDMRGQQLPFVRAGYILSSLSKSLIVLIPHIAWALFMRTSDRLGKGIRTGARDALLSHESKPEDRGKVFGFHRAMDTTGAFIGPLLALWWMMTHRDGDIRDLFLYALVPAGLSLILLFLLKDGKATNGNGIKPPSLLKSFSYWSQSGKDFRRLISGLVMFTAFNSTDLFLLMAIKEMYSDQLLVVNGFQFTANETVIVYYMLYNLVYAAAAYPAGILADKLNMRTILTSGYVLFALVYAGMIIGLNQPQYASWIVPLLMLCYGMYSALTEGIAKAWVSLLVPREEKASALGFYAGVNSIAALCASIVAGLLWSFISPSFTFGLTAVAALCAAFFLRFFTRLPDQKNGH